MRAQLLRCRRRTGERHQVLRSDVVQEVADAARDELQRAFGQDAGLDDQLDQPGGQVRGLTGGLDQARHAGQERGRELLQGAPHREVERVDLDRHAAQRGRDVLAEERAFTAQRLDVAVDVHRVVRQLALALRGVGEQHAYAAVDVELRVTQRRACACGECVQLLAVLTKV